MPEVKLNDYAEIIGEQTIKELRILGERLHDIGESILHVNSTAIGGGVAEILSRLVPLFQEVGVPARWEVIKGGEAFFDITKAFHNALHGRRETITKEMLDIYLAENKRNGEWIDFRESTIVIHDPQPISLIYERYKNPEAKWIWRCHIDISNPQPDIWEFMQNFICKYDGSIFSSPSFAKLLDIPQYMICPSIDPLSDKNRELTQTEIEEVLIKCGIKSDKPIVTQISRFDILKDPIGVIKAYRLAKKYIDFQLVLAGGTAVDDPEGEAVLSEVRKEAGDDPDIHLVLLPPTSSKEINALQRASTVILQKSIKEGFALTVAEALWKRKPVIATAVGGIPLQIHHNVTGILVYSIEGCAYQIRYLLSNPEEAKRLGENGHEHIKRNFLLTRHLKDYLLLIIAAKKPDQNIIYFAEE